MSEEAIFVAALERPPAERPAFLDEACGEDAKLRTRVEQLLASHDNPDSIFDSPAHTEAAKPSNLLLAPDGRLSVNDFGLARMLEQPGMTTTGEFVGLHVAGTDYGRTGAAGSSYGYLFVGGDTLRALNIAYSFSGRAKGPGDSADSAQRAETTSETE